VLNAGVALYAANVTNTMQAGVDKAREAIESGAAKAKLAQLVAATKSVAK
jgi:anthranilate phosphoribosyltransferase